MVCGVVKRRPGIVFFSLDETKFAGSNAGFERSAHFFVRGFTHATPQGVTKESTFVGDGFALEASLAGKSHGFLRHLPHLFGDAFLELTLASQAGLRHNPVGLIAEFGGQFAMSGQYLGRRLDHLLIAGGVSGDLRSLMTGEAMLFHMAAYLIPPKA